MCPQSDPPAPQCLADAVRRIFTSQFRSRIPGTVFGSDVEGIHETRVAIRRLRSTMSSYKPFLAHKPAQLVLHNLKIVDRYVSPVRDLDVSANLAQRILATKNLQVHEQLHSWLADQRAEYCVRLESDQADEGAHQRRVLIRLYGHAVPLKRTIEVESSDFKQVLRVVLAQHVASLTKEAASCLSQPSATKLHQLRLLAKGVRYQCDALSDLDIRGMDRALWYAKTLHTELGKLQDYRTLHLWLKDHRHLDAGFAGLEESMQDNIMEQRKQTLHILAATHMDFLRRH